MITLLPTRLHWISDDGIDDPNDLCAHSPVHFAIDGETLVSPEDGDVTVSAAAIFLLRTLDQEHTQENPVAGQLFPCCGFSMYDTGGEDVEISGCPNGSDVIVTHERNSVVRITSASGKFYSVAAHEWRRAIHQFSDAVREFYDRSGQNVPTDEVETKGYAKFRSEWDRRRNGPSV
jgi:hypothetical protein